MVHLVFNTSSRRIKPAVAGSIPAPSAIYNPIIPIMNELQQKLSALPGVDKLLEHYEILDLLNQFPSRMVKAIIRNTLAEARETIKQETPVTTEDLIAQIVQVCGKNFQASLKPVVNATGILIHTNLGRAPLGRDILEESMDILEAYNNLEFDLDKGKRGSRYKHVSSLICRITGAESALVVNNNAAALMLILRTFAKNMEVIVSRSELIEIGGSFRLPDIMAASDCKMIEVGTTNKTRIDDYANHITEQTNLLLKAHWSNFIIKGFTEEVGLEQLALLGKERGILTMLDLGSGLPDNRIHPLLKSELDIRTALNSGIDLICFSGDKLFNGPQAGIILGSKDLIDILKKEQMTRALRVSKTTLAILEATCKRYLKSDLEALDLPFYRLLNRSQDELYLMAEKLKKCIEASNLPCEIIPSEGKVGGGSLPEAIIPSFSVELAKAVKKPDQENLFKSIMQANKPVVGNLIKGRLSFNLLSLFENDFQTIENALSWALELSKNKQDL